MNLHDVLVIAALLFPFGFAAGWIAMQRRRAETARATVLLERVGVITPEQLQAERSGKGGWWRLNVCWLNLCQTGLAPGLVRKLLALSAAGAVVDVLVLLSPVAISARLGLLLAALPLAPLAYIGYRYSLRRRRFSAQFPDALEAMVRALYSGHTVDQAMRTIAEDFPPPLADEFRLMNKHMQLGVPVRDVLREFQERLPLPEVQYFTTTVIVQRESGGQLAAILGELARVMRRRSLFQGKLRALTAESRFTALFVGGAPLAYLAYKYLFDRAAVAFFLEDPTGISLLKLSLGLITIGVLLLHQLMRLRF